MPLATAGGEGSPAELCADASVRSDVAFGHKDAIGHLSDFDRLGEGRKQQPIVQPACVKPGDNDRNKNAQTLHGLIVDNARRR